MNNLVLANQASKQMDDAGLYVPQTANKATGLWNFVFFGFIIMTFFVGGFAYWSITAKLDGAVVAPASFVVEGNRKTVQHLEGGYVSDLLVKDGDFVEADQVLIRMDSTENDVNLDVLGGQFVELNVRRARLLAEVDEKDSFELSDITSVIDGPFDADKMQSVYRTQKKVFDTQLSVRQSSEEIVEQRVASLQQEIDGLQEQREAGDRQITIAQQELAALETLLKQGYTSANRVNVVRREIERLIGQDASFKTSQARALNQIGELRLTAIGEKKARKEAVTVELADVQAQISSIEPRYVGEVLKQKRIEVKAPVSGRVVNLNIYTKGGVIRPGEPIMDIVPVDEELIVEAKINTTDIEKLRIGQTTRIRLTAFDLSDVPEANGQIIDLSADSVKDEATGADFFLAKVKLAKKQPETVEGLEFVPGMPADVFINTGEKTAISYLTQPLQDRIARTFIE